MRLHVYIISILSIILLRADLGNGVEWAKTFQTDLNAHVLKLGCTHKGFAVCCEAVETRNNSMNGGRLNKHRGVGIGYGENFIQQTIAKHIQHKFQNRQCTITREYFPSEYELKHIEKAKEIVALPTVEERKKMLVDYVTSVEETENCRKWLNRVKERTLSEDNLPESPIDQKYLSKFKVTRSCKPVSLEDHKDSHHSAVSHELLHRSITNVSWFEWIEPITVHARHPFSLQAYQIGLNFPNLPNNEKVALINSEHILLQSAWSQYNETVPNFGQRQGQITKHFMFDAGTSNFDSSMYWFTCAYSQRRISYDQLYGWELSLLEPNDFWSKVPPLWKPFYHFFDIPVASGLAADDSPLRFVKEIATEDDFVAFKLDIDHPDTEIPIALALLNDDELPNLVDEFFFELHFSCELLGPCCWGEPQHMVYKSPIVKTEKSKYDLDELKMDRYGALDYFQRLRFKGVRSHIWP